MVRKLWCACAVVALGAAAVGCSNGASGTPAKAPTKAAAASAHPVSSQPPATPTLAVGRPVVVREVGDGVMVTGTSAYQVALVGVKTATKVTDKSDGYVAHADSGKSIVCVELKVQLTSGKADTYPFINPSFEGANGQASDAELATGVGCGSMGLADDDLSEEPDPKVGQFIDGSQAVEVPAGGGDLLFTDRSGVDLFKVSVPKA